MNRTISTANPISAMQISAMRLAVATRRQRRPYSMEPTPPGLEHGQSSQRRRTCQVTDDTPSCDGDISGSVGALHRPGNAVGCELAGAVREREKHPDRAGHDWL